MIDNADILREKIIGRPPLPHNILEVNRTIAVDEFFAFTECYDLSNPQIAHKQSHTLRVTLNADKIAMRAANGEELYAIDKPQRAWIDGCWVPDTGVCFLMGLLHDLGRFPQYAMYRTYSDAQSFPHAEMSYVMLTKFGMVDRFAPLRGSDSMQKAERNRMLEGIRNHSLLNIGAITGQERAYCEILREADRIDILEAYCHAVSSPDFSDCIEEFRRALERHEPLPNVNPADSPTIYDMACREASGFAISDAVLADVAKGGLVNRGNIRTAGDSIMSVIALWLDMEISISRKMLAERNTMQVIGESIIDTYEKRSGTTDLIREVRRIIDL